MINMTQFVTNTVAENTVVVNGAQFKCTDDVTLKILELIGIGGNSQTVSASNTSKTSVSKTENKPYVATKDFTPQYQIKEYTSTDGTQLFCISRKNGWTKSEKSLMNGAIKSLKGIKEIEVKGTKTDKKTGVTSEITFKAWGYNTESTAKKHLKELPTVFTVAQLNGEA